jgi:23S rRNA (guanosine2251-2'-O)-methyltransferase
MSRSPSVSKKRPTSKSKPVKPRKPGKPGKARKPGKPGRVSRDDKPVTESRTEGTQRKDSKFVKPRPGKGERYKGTETDIDDKQERSGGVKSRRRAPFKERPTFELPEGVVYLTSRHTCEAVLRYQPRRVRHIYLLEGGKGLDLHLKLAQGIRCRISFESRMELDDRAPDVQHQGVILEVEEFPTVDLEDLPRSEVPLWVGLDGVQDPRNLGAAARACYAFGADGLCIPKNRAAQVTPITEKIAVGALSRLPVAQVTNLRRAMDYARKEGFWIVGAEANGDAAPWEVDMRRPMFLLMGGEDSGLRRLTRENCDQIVRLPTPRPMSLNAADALTVFLYELNRQRQNIE